MNVRHGSEWEKWEEGEKGKTKKKEETEVERKMVARSPMSNKDAGTPN